jgi:hypothetical protein
VYLSFFLSFFAQKCVEEIWICDGYTLQISRGKSRLVSTHVTVRGCPTSAFWGPYCNQTVEMIGCSQPSKDNNSSNLLDLNIERRNSRYTREHHRRINILSQQNHLVEKEVGSNVTALVGMENSITCSISNNSLCIRQGDMKFYFLDVVNLALQFQITTTNFGVLGPSLMCYLRYNAFPQRDLHDYSGDISHDPLVVKSPNIGRWYIAIETVNKTQTNNTASKPVLDTMCFSLKWQLTGCLNGKSGTDCSWEAYGLQVSLYYCYTISTDTNSFCTWLAVCNNPCFPLYPIEDPVNLNAWYILGSWERGNTSAHI